LPPKYNFFMVRLNFFYIPLLFSLIVLSQPLKAQRIFMTDSIANADIKVYVTTDSTAADLKVCVVDSVHKVYKDGIWYVVNQLQLSTLTVKMVNDPLDADIKIYYVTQPKKAGWIDTNKRFYYRRKK